MRKRYSLSTSGFHMYNMFTLTSSMCNDPHEYIHITQNIYYNTHTLQKEKEKRYFKAKINGNSAGLIFCCNKYRLKPVFEKRD